MTIPGGKQEQSGDPASGTGTAKEQATLRSEELRPGELREVRIFGRPVLLARLRSGEVMAAAAACPHEAASLAEGTIRGDAVDCPRHHYLFDLRTGRNMYPYPIYPEWKRKEVGDLNLPILPCREEAGCIRVTLTAPGAPAS